MSRGHGLYMSGFTTGSLQSVADLQDKALPTANSIPSIHLEDAGPPPLALRYHKKHQSVTLPVSVLHSITGLRPPRPSFVQQRRPSIETMARPRSPKKHHSSQELSQAQMESQLDLTLLAIREKLNHLSSNRVQLEHQMDSLTSGIKEASVQCSRRMSSRSSSSSIHSTSLRRVRSIGEAEAFSVNPRTPRKAHQPREEVDGIVSDDAWSMQSHSSMSNSREDFKGSPEFSRSGLNNSYTSDSLASSLSQSSVFTSSLSSSLPHIHEVRGGSCEPSRDRTSSNASSTINRVSVANLDHFIDDWFSAAIIPELPESPRSLTPSKPLWASRDVTTSPFSFSHQNSTPDMNDKRKFYTSPRLHRVRGPIPDDFTHKANSNNDSLENTSTENLSQVGLCVENGSPARTGSTTIIRRSSLTGQLEHVRRPRVVVKRNSSFNLLANNAESSLTSASSYGSIGDSPRSSGRRSKSPRPIKYSRQYSVILPSIETCV